MWCRLHYLCAILSVISLACSSPLGACANRIIQLPPDTTGYPPINASLLVIEVENLKCEEGRTTWNTPPLFSCQQAINSIPDDATQITIGHRGQRAYSATVPWQVLSRKQTYYELQRHPLIARVNINIFHSVTDAFLRATKRRKDYVQSRFAWAPFRSLERT